MAVISGLGIYLPKQHHTAADIAAASGVPEAIVRDKLGLTRKTVPGPDDHTNAMGVHAAQAIATATHRLEAERLGLEAFLQFTSKHRGLYRIVQESQFVDPQIFREYYETLAEGYAGALAAAARKGELSEGDAETRAWSLMGIGHFLGQRWCLWQKKQPSPEVLDEVMRFITHGMGPSKT